MPAARYDRQISGDDVPAGAGQHAAPGLTEAGLAAAARAGALTAAVGTLSPLDRIAGAHEQVGAGTRSRALREIPA